jgi:lipopolysaccharide export system protein LptC
MRQSNAVPVERAEAASDPAPRPSGRPHSAPRSRPGRGAGAGRAYTQFVTTMKVVLPLLAVLLLGAVVAWPELTETATERREVDAADPGRMISPRLAGTDAEERPYSLVGTSARQSDAGSDVVVFEDLEAEITLENGLWLALLAEHGRMDNASGLIELAGNVNLFRDDGYTFYADQMYIDVNEGTAWTDVPVHAHGPAGEIAAQGFRIANDAGVVVFTGESELLLRRAPRDTLR